MMLGVVITLSFSILAAAIIVAFILRDRKAEVRYVDTSGVVGTPVKQFAEVWRGKTLNFKIDEKHSITIPHVSVPRGLSFLERIAGSYGEMVRLQSVECTSAIDRNRVDIRILQIYKQAILAVYYLSKPFASIGFKRALTNKAMNDFIWFTDILEQINDYWLLQERKKKLVAQGTTLKQTDGVQSTWSGLTLDRTGKRLIKQRYANS